MKLFIKKVRDEAKIPTRAHTDDAGIDLYACGEHIVAPRTQKVIPTGVALEIEKGCAGLIWDKSSVGSRGLKTLGGVVDAGYRGEIQVIIYNMSDTPYTFEHHHKVAQMLIQRVELPEMIEIDSLRESVRGEGGFGSTGK